MAVISLNQIKDDTVTQLIAAGICGGKVENSRSAKVRVEDLPQARVYLRQENGQSEGAPNHGPAKFKRVVTLAIAITDKDEDAAVIKVDEVLVALFEFQPWLDLFEAIDSYTVEYESLSDGESNEVEALISITLDIQRVEYTVPVTDDLQRVTGRDDNDDDGGLIIGPDGTPVAPFNIEIPQ